MFLSKEKNSDDDDREEEVDTVTNNAYLIEK